MVDLFLITGYNNVSAFNNNEFDEIDLDFVFHKRFENEKERQIFISALYLLDNTMHSMSGNYAILNEEEYRSII